MKERLGQADIDRTIRLPLNCGAVACRVVTDVGGEQPSLGELECLVEGHKTDGLAVTSRDTVVGDGEELLVDSHVKHRLPGA